MLVCCSCLVTHCKPIGWAVERRSAYHSCLVIVRISFSYLFICCLIHLLDMSLSILDLLFSILRCCTGRAGKLRADFIALALLLLFPYDCILFVFVLHRADTRLHGECKHLSNALPCSRLHACVPGCLMFNENCFLSKCSH